MAGRYAPPGARAYAARMRLPRSRGSILSVASEGSVLCVGCSGSVLSVGSVGSALSAFSIGSAGSVLSAFSAGSVLSAFSAGGAGRVLERPARAHRGVGLAAAGAGAAFLAWRLRR
jgi:hypothetical protein